MSETKVPFKFKKTRAITLPLFKWQNGVERYYRIDASIFQGKQIKGDTSGKEPAFLANVTDLETGETGQIILGTVLRGILHDEFPEDTYVGRSFAITQSRDAGKDYNHYSVIEIEPDEVDEKPAAKVKAVK